MCAQLPEGARKLGELGLQFLSDLKEHCRQHEDPAFREVEPLLDSVLHVIELQPQPGESSVQLDTADTHDCLACSGTATPSPLHSAHPPAASSSEARASAPVHRGSYSDSHAHPGHEGPRHQGQQHHEGGHAEGRRDGGLSQSPVYSQTETADVYSSASITPTSNGRGDEESSLLSEGDRFMGQTGGEERGRASVGVGQPVSAGQQPQVYSHHQPDRAQAHLPASSDMQETWSTANEQHSLAHS